MPNHPQTMAEDNKSVFDFMSLPQELKDWSYDYMVADAPITLQTPHGNFFKLHLHRTPQTALLLVSRQFCKEYQDRASKLPFLSIQDHRECEFNVPAIPQTVEKVPLSDVCLLAFRHNTVSDVERHTTWMTSYFPLMNAKAVEIKLYCETDDMDAFKRWPDSSKHHQLKTALENMVRIPGIVRLRLYWYDGTPECEQSEGHVDEEAEEEARKNIDEVLKGPQNLMETWTKDEGWELHRQAVSAKENETCEPHNGTTQEESNGSRSPDPSHV